MNTQVSRGRQGLSLLEVVLAMAILAGSMVVLSQLVGMGLRAAARTRDLTRAQIIAETVASEIAAGVTPASPVTRMALELDPGWLASIDVGTTPQDGVIHVTILIEQDTGGARPTRFELSRWMRDPTLPPPVDETALDETGTSASTGTTSSGAGGRG